MNKKEFENIYAKNANKILDIFEKNKAMLVNAKTIKEDNIKGKK